MIKEHVFTLSHSPAGSAVAQVLASDSLAPIDVHDQLRRKSSDTRLDGDRLVIDTPETRSVGFNAPLDIKTWLPFAAPHYHISPNIDDYVLTPVIIMPTDLPNRNSVAFPLDALTEFLPEYGMQAYMTWKGQPTFREHKNDDITEAYGVMADVSLRRMRGFGKGKVWKVLALLAFDRTKHPDVVAKILSREYNSYSMGAYVEHYTCSYCGKQVGKGCPHLDPNKQFEIYELDGRLVFKNCKGVKGFETSIVDNPAYQSALSDTLILPAGN